jgi:hypothetical protein
MPRLGLAKDQPHGVHKSISNSSTEGRFVYTKLGVEVDRVVMDLNGSWISHESGSCSSGVKQKPESDCRGIELLVSFFT